MDTSCVKQSDSPSTLHTYEIQTASLTTRYYDTPNYVVDVLEGAVSHTDVFPKAEIADTVLPASCIHVTVQASHV